MDLFFSLMLTLCALLTVIPLLVNRRWLVLPVALAFVARLSTAIIHRHIFPLPQGGTDAMMFDRVAIGWANEYGCTGFFEHFNPSASYVYSSIVATIYGCIDYVPFSVQVVNVIFGVYGVMFLTLAVNKVWGAEAARKAGVILAIFPLLVIFSSVGLRESFIFSGFSLGIYALILYYYGKGVPWLCVSVAAFYFASLFHGAMALAIGGIAVGMVVKPLLTPAKTKAQFASALLLFVLLIALALIGLAYIYTNISLHKIGSLEELDVDQISEIAQSRSTGDAAYLSGLQVNNAIDFIWQIPLRIIYLLFSPFPWNISNPAHILGMFDGIFYLVMTFYCIKYRKIIFQNEVLVQVIIILIILSLAFAFGTSNFGTATRHRAKFYLAMLVVVAPCFLARWRAINKK